MTLLELVKHLRESILDDTGGTGVVWEDLDEDNVDSSQLRWTNEELTNLINEAILQVHRRILLIKDASGDYDITVGSGDSDYALDDRIIRIKGAKLVSNGKQLVRAEIEDLWGLDDWDGKVATPTSYVVDYETGGFKLYPIPVVDDTVKLLVYRTETNPLVWASNSVSPEMTTRYQIPMLNYAAHLAYNKDEANTFDPKRSEFLLALFTREFPGISAYSEVRRSRTSHRGIRYRDVI